MIGQRRSPDRLKRQSRGLKEFKRLLIVCEGSKTEPDYLRDVCRSLRLRTTQISIIGKECGSAPITVYQYAADQYQQDSSFDEIYCVFDRDRHTTFDEAVDACINHPSKKFFPIRSHPCFEYWILLHFRYTRASIVEAGKYSPGDVALQLVKKEWPEYEKGAKGTFQFLEKQKRTETALASACRARSDAAATLNPNPSTEMDLLLHRLRALAQEQTIG